MSGPATVPSRLLGGSDVGLDVGGGAFDEVPAADVGHQGGVRVRGRDVGEVERVSGASQTGQGGADQGSGEAFFEVVQEASGQDQIEVAVVGGQMGGGAHRRPQPAEPNVWGPHRARVGPTRMTGGSV